MSSLARVHHSFLVSLLVSGTNLLSDDRPRKGFIVIPNLRFSRAARALTVVAALTLVASACGSSSKPSSSTSGTGANSGGKVTLNGSGSTFQQTFNQAAIQGFQGTNPNITVNYAGKGSGAGKTDLQTETVQWAGTDSTIKDADKSKYQGGTVLYFPTVAGPITVSYNLSGLNKPLQLSGPTLAQIFSGKLKTWNAAPIASDNPGVNLPSTNIVVVHRADASGTTSNFTTFLVSAGGSDWTLGSSDSLTTWPAGSQAGQGNSGMAQIVKQTSGAIAYVDFSTAKASNLTFASIKNKAGDYVAPTLDGASAAVASATINPDLTYNPINAPGATAYPITSPTWVIVYQKQPNANVGNALKSWLSYLVNGAQSLATQAEYAPLPASLQQKANAQLSQLQIG
jgi:phosphate transport system substrate-binding protein